MVGPFSLRVSAEPVCGVLAVDVARRYVELSGGSGAVAAAFATAVAGALDVVANGGEAIDLAFSAEGGEVTVAISCGGRHQSCRVPLA